MAKVALLIGVSHYDFLEPLPGAAKDAEVMEQVLRHPDMGGFDTTRLLINTDPQRMREEIEALFLNRSKGDLVLLFFSGHGVKDTFDRFYFATPKTDKNRLSSTAISSGFIHDLMKTTDARQQVMILDCCFSGGFAKGMDVRNFADAALLTSSGLLEYSKSGESLSTYTKYLIEGIKTGAIDQNQDGWISVVELHDYAKEKVQTETPAMTPQIYPLRQGFTINLVKAPVRDLQLLYRQEVARFAHHLGDITAAIRPILEMRRTELGLPVADANIIEEEVLQPYRERQKKLDLYEQFLREVIQREFSE